MDRARDQLNAFIETYQTLTEKEKFGLAKIFQDRTGGKLSPFNSPSPVCVALIPVTGPDGEIGFLGARRAIPPFVGEVALAGGFLSTSEDPIAGAVREVLEETGIQLDPSLFSSECIPKMGHNNNLLMFFKSTEVLNYKALEKANQNLKDTDGEASEIVFISPKTSLCFPLHQEAVNTAFREMNIAPQVDVAKSLKM